MSAVGTTLLQSPGWNEGKARYATLGKHRQKRIELRRSGTTEHSFGLCHCWVAVGGVPLLKELKGCRKRLTQGLRPGLCRSIALAGLIYVFTNQLLLLFYALTSKKKQRLLFLFIGKIILTTNKKHPFSCRYRQEKSIFA